MPDDDGGWGKWSIDKVSEVDDSTWLIDPKSATARTLASGARELAAQAHANATQQAVVVGQLIAAAAQLDAEFGARHPDLMETETERLAVRTVIGRLQSDARFQAGLRTARGREKVYDAVAILARRELGRDENATMRSGDSRGSVRGKVLPHQMAAARQFEAGPRDAEAMDEVIDHARATNKFGGGI